MCLHHFICASLIAFTCGQQIVDPDASKQKLAVLLQSDADITNRVLGLKFSGKARTLASLLFGSYVSGRLTRQMFPSSAIRPTRSILHLSVSPTIDYRAAESGARDEPPESDLGGGYDAEYDAVALQDLSRLALGDGLQSEARILSELAADYEDRTAVDFLDALQAGEAGGSIDQDPQSVAEQRLIDLLNIRGGGAGWFTRRGNRKPEESQKTLRKERTARRGASRTKVNAGKLDAKERTTDHKSDPQGNRTEQDDYITMLPADIAIIASGFTNFGGFSDSNYPG